MKILAVVGDTHTNSTLGLCPPYVELDDGGQYLASEFQLALWNAWEDYVGCVSELSLEQNAPVFTVFNGDITDGDHHNTSQIITRNTATMQRIAVKALSPLIDVSDRVYVIRGTASHTGGAGAKEEEFARDISAVHSSEGVSSWYSLLINVNGVIVDIAHHTTMGRLPWTSKNAANKLAATSLFNYANRGMRLPDLVFRSHNHRYADSYDSFRVRAVCLPGWQGKTEYISQLDATAIPDIGGAIVLCRENGAYEVIIKRYPFATPAPRMVDADDEYDDA
jgi:hypothetical protein